MNREILKLVSFAAGSFVVLASLVAIGGYVVDNVYMVTWGQETKMALPTSVLFLTIGLWMVTFGTSVGKGTPK